MHPQSTKVALVCAHCGAAFERYASQINRPGRGRFCSVACGRRALPRPSAEERFWAKVDKTESCWNWTAAKLASGHAVFARTADVLCLAYRYSYELAYGAIPDGLYICHHCDNPSCVRPDHLFAGTQTDNMRDMAAKGRGGRYRNPKREHAPRTPNPPRQRIRPERLKVAEDFWARLDKSGDCWLWTGNRTPTGYGQVSIRGVGYYAHRLAYELTNGAIAEGLFVAHTCDNPPCANPSHLFLATPRENIQDAARKGRMSGWSRQKGAKKINTKMNDCSPE